MIPPENLTTTETLPITSRTQVKRIPKRGIYERQSIYQILDEGLICQLGFVVDGQPFVIPTAYGRVGDRVYVHGAPREPDAPHVEKGSAGLPHSYAVRWLGVSAVSVSPLDELSLGGGVWRGVVGGRSKREG